MAPPNFQDVSEPQNPGRHCKALEGIRRLLYPGLFLILLICFTLMSEKCPERTMLILFLSWSFSPTSALEILFHSSLKHLELLSSIVSKQSEGWDCRPTNGVWIFSKELLMHCWRIVSYSTCLLHACPRIEAKVRCGNYLWSSILMNLTPCCFNSNSFIAITWDPSSFHLHFQ